MSQLSQHLEMMNFLLWCVYFCLHIAREQFTRAWKTIILTQLFSGIAEQYFLSHQRLLECSILIVCVGIFRTTNCDLDFTVKEWRCGKHFNSKSIVL